MKALSEEQALQLSIMLLQNDKNVKEELENIISNKMTAIGTTSDKLSDIVIKDNQLLYVADKNIVALDFNGNRKFLNQIIIFDNDDDRLSFNMQKECLFYFVKSTATIWCYLNDEWIQVTQNPTEIIYIGESLPEFGSENKLYVDKKLRSISVWDDEKNEYLRVGNASSSIPLQDIDEIFTKK